MPPRALRSRIKTLSALGGMVRGRSAKNAVHPRWRSV